MAEKYMNCESELRMSLCMSTSCMCSLFLESAANNRADIKNNELKIQCAVYDFSSKEIRKYGFGRNQIRIVEDDELESITVI